MKTLIATLAAVAAVTTAAPAAAQVYGYDHDRHAARWDRGHNINARQHELSRLIEMGERRGTLTAKEAWVLRREFHDLMRLEAQYRRGGLNGRERANLNRRLDRLETAVVRNMRDGQRDYGHGYGRWR